MLKILDKILTDDSLKLLVQWKEEKIFFDLPLSCRNSGEEILKCLDQADTLEEWMSALSKLGYIINIIRE